MAGKLTALKVQKAKPGKYADGGNLYLLVAKTGSRKWVCRYRFNGRGREMGLGSTTTVSLAEARERTNDAMRMVARNEDPISAKKLVVGIPTFGMVVEEVCLSLEVGFRNAKHRAQWRNTLATYAGKLNATRVDQVTTDDVVTVLRPIWTSKPETASRLRGRIERVLDAAKAKGHRTGENPARWRGHLDNLLPKQSKLVRGHHAAMAYTAVAPFLEKLRAMDTMPSKALEFCILTAARSGEVLGATWNEIDLQQRVWTIPGVRMKAGRVHTVPLSNRAVEILSLTDIDDRHGPVFFGAKRESPLSNMAMAMVLRRMKLDVTVHGFRSSFRDWAGNETEFPRDIIETALAHVIGDKAEQAYRRGDALERRRKVMNAWAAYCCTDK